MPPGSPPRCSRRTPWPAPANPARCWCSSPAMRCANRRRWQISRHRRRHRSTRPRSTPCWPPCNGPAAACCCSARAATPPPVWPRSWPKRCPPRWSPPPRGAAWWPKITRCRWVSPSPATSAARSTRWSRRATWCWRSAASSPTTAAAASSCASRRRSSSTSMPARPCWAPTIPRATQCARTRRSSWPPCCNGWKRGRAMPASVTTRSPAGVGAPTTSATGGGSNRASTAWTTGSRRRSSPRCARHCRGMAACSPIRASTRAWRAATFRCFARAA